MIEFLLWIFFGVLTGWVGYLVTRTHESTNMFAYLIIGTVGAVAGGFATRNIGDSQFALDPVSLFIALGSAVLGVVCIIFFGRVSAD